MKLKVLDGWCWKSVAGGRRGQKLSKPKKNIPRTRQGGYKEEGRELSSSNTQKRRREKKLQGGAHQKKSYKGGESQVLAKKGKKTPRRIL